MGRRIMLVALAWLAATTTAQAQGTGRVTGQVLSAEGSLPLAGATVALVGTTRAVLTDAAGRFTLADVPIGARRVQARRLGFVSQTLPVTVTAGQATNLTITLVVSPIQLEEIRTVGFGTQEARTVTGAVATVSAEKIKDIPTSDPMKAIQGRVPGVDIVANNNEPGTSMQVRIRGVRSLQASNEPLYVVDGIPISGGIQDFNPAIIESIDVLKDAAATAIYGSRGANGVILVTTKKGTLDGRSHSSYTLDTYYGQQSAVKTLTMMNMQQYVQMLRDGAAYANGAFNGDTSIAKILAGQSFVNGVPKKLYAYNNGVETDWFKTVLQDAQQKSFQGNLTGNTPDTRYTLSGNWFDQGGLIPGQGYRRGSGFASLNHTKGRLNVGLSANSARIYQDIGEGGGAFGYTAAMAPFGSPYNYTNPDSAGLFDPRPDDDQLNINPLLENRSFVRQRTTNRIFGSAYAQLQLMDGLSFRTNFGPDFTNVGEGCYNDPWTHGPCANPGANSQNQGAPPQAFYRNAYDFAYTLDNLLQLSRDIGTRQHLEATALYSIQHDRANRDSIYASNLPYNTQLWYDLGSGTAGQQLSNVSEWALRSYMYGAGQADFTAALADAKAVIASGTYTLEPVYADLWCVARAGDPGRGGYCDNTGYVQNKREFIFTVQFNHNQANNDVDGTPQYNYLHLVFNSQYDNSAAGVGIPRDINNGRPFRRLKPTQYGFSVFNQRYAGTPGASDILDTRFDGSYQTVWYATTGGQRNPIGTCPANQTPQVGLVACTSNAVVNVGDTTIMYANYAVDNTKRQASKYTIRTTCLAGLADPSVYCGDNSGENNGYIGWDRYPVLKKFQDNLRLGGFNDQNGGKVQVVFRLGEVYLIAAEADLGLGNTTEAAQMINVLRTRAASANHKTDLAFQVAPAQITLDFIMDERERELAGEFNRWYDLVRPGPAFFLARVQKYNPKAKANVQAKHALRPVPQSQIDGVVLGPKYPQNPGY